jgi:hypothetical protein
VIPLHVATQGLVLAHNVLPIQALVVRGGHNQGGFDKMLSQSYDTAIEARDQTRVDEGGVTRGRSHGREFEVSEARIQRLEADEAHDRRSEASVGRDRG